MRRLRLRVSRYQSLAGLLFASASLPANAAYGQTTNIGGVQSTATGVSAAANAGSAPQTAAQFAPSLAPINEQQPESVIGAEALDKFTIPTEDYDDIVALTPSAMDINPAGPGLQQDFGQSIRGLQYTEFSVLYDGVQVQPSPGNLSPQPAVYFMEHDLGSITVNRGPGLASDIGSATFGGFIALSSPNLSATPTVETYGTVGSFETNLYGIEGESGTIDELDGARVALDLSKEESNGADSGISTERRNLFLKYAQPIGRSTVVTTLVNLDNDDTHTPYGVTQQDALIYGRNYGLNQNPSSVNYAGYNRDAYTSDFEYVRVQSDLGAGFKIDNTSYTEGYFHRGTTSIDPGGTTPAFTGTIYVNGVPTKVTDIIEGSLSHNDQRDWGDTLRFSKDTTIGQARVGVWFDHIDNTIYKYNVDFTNGYAAYATSATKSPYSYLVFDTLTTVQPYGEFEFHPASNVTIIAGVKYDAVTRSLQAPINRTTATYADDHAAFNRVLPAFSANWRIVPSTSVYAQATKGYLTPPLNLFYTNSVTSVSPSWTWNFQVGSVFQRRWLSVGADLYYIEYNNYITSNTIATNTVYSNAGGAVFKGVEVEGTGKLGYGVALYANGSLNDSNYTNNGNNLAQTPRRTAAIGLIYDKGGFIRPHDDLHGLVIVKNVGPQYGLDTSASGQSDQFPIRSYSTINLDAGYVLPIYRHRLSFDVQVYNLADNKSFIGYDGETASGAALYWLNPGRSIFFSESDSDLMCNERFFGPTAWPRRRR